MKPVILSWKTPVLIVASAILLNVANAQTDKDERIINDSKRAKEEFIKTDKKAEILFDDSYGYVIFPNVGKGAFGIGGAAGNGVLFEKGDMLGMAKLKQISIGFQMGGQAYREVIFFENEEALDRFKNNNFEFAAQATAVALKSGAAANAKYRDGVIVFTQLKG